MKNITATKTATTIITITAWHCDYNYCDDCDFYDYYDYKDYYYDDYDYYHYYDYCYIKLAATDCKLVSTLLLAPC